jgi:hypothetical protein
MKCRTRRRMHADVRKRPGRIAAIGHCRNGRSAAADRAVTEHEGAVVGANPPARGSVHGGTRSKEHQRKAQVTKPAANSFCDGGHERSLQGREAIGSDKPSRLQPLMRRFTEQLARYGFASIRISRRQPTI